MTDNSNCNHVFNYIPRIINIDQILQFFIVYFNKDPNHDNRVITNVNHQIENYNHYNDHGQIQIYVKNLIYILPRVDNDVRNVIIRNIHFHLFFNTCNKVTKNHNTTKINTVYTTNKD